MSLPKPDVHVRLSEKGMAALEALATSKSKDKGRVAGELLERALLGEVHGLIEAAQKLNRLGMLGSGRE